MKNSDLFLELFDDELLRPQENVVVESSLGSGFKQTTPHDAPSENSAPTGSQNRHDSCDKICQSDETSKKAERTEFDFCSALDDEKKRREKKYNRMVAKIKGEKILDLSREGSVLHRGDTDSSEDEDNKYMESCNYNSFGIEIKRLLETSKNDVADDDTSDHLPLSTDSYPTKSDSETDHFTSNRNDHKQLSLPQKRIEKSSNEYVDPFFGIRITDPVISREGMRIRMTGKDAVGLSRLQTHFAKKPEKDFVVAAVLVRSVTKQAQNESQYMIWELSELKDDKPSVSLFLFGQSYKQLWKTPLATVVAILNPTTGNKKGASKPEENLSLVVNQPDQVMIWGKSKDYALCKSTKKNGERCSAVVNRSICEYCVYHVSKEYSKFSSGRSDIRSYIGNSGSNFLRNKVLGKNEVFYGGKSYAALKGGSSPGVKVKEKVNVKDKQRLSILGCNTVDSKPESKVRSNTVCLPYSARAAQALRAVNTDCQILKSLSSPTSYGPVEKMQGSVGNGSNELERVIRSDKRCKGISDGRLPTLSDPANDDREASKGRGKMEKKITTGRPFLNIDANVQKSPTASTEIGGKSVKVVRTVSSSKSHKATTDKSRSESVFPVLTDPDRKDSERGCLDVRLARKSGHTVSEPAKVESRSSLSSETVARTGRDLQTKFKSLFSVASVDVSAKTKSNEKILNTPQSEVDSSSPGCSSESNVKAQAKVETGSASKDTGGASSSRILYPDTAPPSRTNMSRAKMRAMMFVQRNGPIAKEDPNSVNKPSDNKSKKRDRSDSEPDSGEGKGVFSELYLQLMRQTSSQQDLIEAEKLRQEEEYFDKMGLREQLEEKMLNTFKIDCKAVKCLQCKYIWFSAADVCKVERHALKIVDAVKRFFRCGNCNNRTVSLHILPVFSCTNCQASNWQRAPMMREKICKNENQLSIRGGEQKFTNSQVTNTSLNLLVPE